MNSIWISARMNFAAQRIALRWAKEHLPEEEYREIEKSYNVMLKWSVVFVIACIPVILAFMLLIFNAPFSKKAEAAAAPDGAARYVMARADYDGNFYWTYNSRKYEHALKDYGLSPEDFEFGDEIKVYVTDAQDVIKVTAVDDTANIRNIEVGVGVLGSILVPVLLIVGVYIPVADRTFGRRWVEFYREFSSRTIHTNA